MVYGAQAIAHYMAGVYTVLIKVAFLFCIALAHPNNPHSEIVALDLNRRKRRKRTLWMLKEGGDGVCHSLPLHALIFGV